MKESTRKLVAAAMAIALLLAGLGVAQADNFDNNVVMSAGGNANNVVEKNVWASFKYFVEKTTESGESSNGDCNVSGASPAVVRIAAPTGVDMRLGTTPVTGTLDLTFTTCGSHSQNNQTVDFRSASYGDYQITHTKVSGHTSVVVPNASAPDGPNFTLKVQDSTRPQVDPLSNVNAPATSDSGREVVFTVSATDNHEVTSIGCMTGTTAVGGGALTPTASGKSRTFTHTFPIGSHSVNCTASDAAGNSRSTGFTVGITPTAPAIGYTLSPAAPDGGGDWYKSNVSLTWNVSGIPTPTLVGCAYQSITADQAATDYSCSATNSAGTAAPVTVSIKRDATPPTSEVSGVSNNGVYAPGSVPTATCVGNDNRSGIASNGTPTTTGTGPFTVTCNGATDVAGNVQTTASAPVTYTVATVPSIDYILSPAAPDGGGGWYKSNVSLTWNVSGIPTPTLVGCAYQAITADQAGTEYSCSAENSAGPAGPVTVSIKRDATPPTSEVSGVSNNGVYAPGSVTVSCVGNDNGSGIASNGTPTTTGTGPTFTVTCNGATDVAGNVQTTASAPVTYTVATVPSIDYILSPAAPDGGGGWYKSNVTLTWNVGGNPAPRLDQRNGCANQAITANQAETAYSCSATNLAGTSATVTVTVKRDATPPTSAVTDVVDGATYVAGFGVPTAGCSATDSPSGVFTAGTPVVDQSPAGTFTVTCSGATDKAGNLQTASSAPVTYKVITMGGFNSNFDSSASVPKAKAGSTLPMKWAFRDGKGNIVSQLSGVTAASVSLSACSDGTGSEEVAAVTAGSSGLQLLADGSYQWSWKTASTWTGCRRLTITMSGTDSAVKRSVDVQLTK